MKNGITLRGTRITDRAATANHTQGVKDTAKSQSHKKLYKKGIPEE